MQVCPLLMFMRERKFPTYDKQPLTAKKIHHHLYLLNNFCLNHDSPTLRSGGQVLGGFQGFI